MTKRIYKYGTGDLVPNGSQYLYSREESMQAVLIKDATPTCVTLVWHYFLVEVKE